MREQRAQLLRHVLITLDGKLLQLKVGDGGLLHRVLHPRGGLGGIVERPELVKGRQERPHDLQLSVNGDLQERARHVGGCELMFQRVQDHHVDDRDIHNFYFRC